MGCKTGRCAEKDQRGQGRSVGSGTAAVDVIADGTVGELEVETLRGRGFEKAGPRLAASAWGRWRREQVPAQRLV